VVVRSIVVGIDGSETSWRAFAMAVGVARRDHGAVHACFVAHTPMPAVGLAGPIAPLEPGIDDDGGDLGRSVREELARAGVAGDFMWCTGDVGRVLEVLADACHADLIVVGRSRHPTLHLGGVPRRLLAMGRRPVLVVP
jgi:nucleotide-binding universal stress UspA family protein